MTVGDSSREAGIRREQELARLFYVSAWSVEELAKSEGVGPRQINLKTMFGRFLDFASGSMVPKSNSGLKTLVERRFRALYAQTDSKGNEHQRFGRFLDHEPTVRDSEFAPIGLAA